MTIQTLFKPDGPLARHIDGFKARAPQLEMAEAVARAIRHGGRLLVEAGTGTGKTYAYLVPALESGKRIVISTGSKNLQEQLFYRDLPTITGALDYTRPVALLKGRSNYLCIERMNRLLAESHLQKPDVLNDLVKVKSWSTTTDNGDVGDIPGLQENAEILPHVTSTNENCLGRDCPYYDDCHLVVARRRAMEAQVVVINHHLFFADMAVKDTGFGELVPEAQVYFDPDTVKGYRLLGYENRDVADRDFRNDAVDGGEVFVGHDTTALYDVELREGAGDASFVRATVRFLDAGGEPVEHTRQLRDSQCAPSLGQAAPRLRQNLVIAMLTDRLTGGPWSRWTGAADLRNEAAALTDSLDSDRDVAELVRLIDRVTT